MVTFRIKVQGRKPYDATFHSAQEAMDAAFSLYPEARSITVGPLR